MHPASGHHTRTLALHTVAAVLLASIMGCGGGHAGSAAPAPVEVTSPHGQVLTLSSSAGQIANASGLVVPAGAPSRYDYPDDLVRFEVTGLAPRSTVTVILETPAGSTPDTYIQCDASLASCKASGNAAVSGNALTLTLTDGGPGDADGMANGVILASGAPAVALAAPSYYLPYSAYTSGDSSPGHALFAIPSNAPSTAPQYLTHDSFYGLAARLTQSLTNDQGQVYARIPYGIVYFESSAIERLDLSATSNLVPTQMSNLQIDQNFPTYPSSGPAVCKGAGDTVFTDQLDASDPSTAFFIVQFPSGAAGSTCGKPGNEYALIHYGDSATTPPTLLPLGGDSTSVVSFHDPLSGKLNGLAAVDPAGNLNYYPDLTFMKPRKLLGNVGGFAVIQATPQYAFIATYPPGSGSDSNNGYFAIAAASLYRVDSQGAISADLYDFQPGGCSFSSSAGDGSAVYYFGPLCNSSAQLAPDGNSLFFADNSFTDSSTDPSSSYPYDITSYSGRLLRVALDGATPAQVIQTVSGGAAPAPHHNHRPVTITLDGFVESALLYTVGAFGSGGSGYPGYVYALDQTAMPGSQATQLAGTPDGYYGVNDLADGALWVNLHRFDPATGNILDVGVLAIAPDGSVAHSYPSSEIWGGSYVMSGTPLNPIYSFDNLFLLTGFASPQPAASLDYDGTALQKLPLDSFGLTPFKTLAGTPYVNSNGAIPSIANYADPVGGAWTYYSNYAAPAAIDPVNDLFVEISNDPNTFSYPLYY